MVKVKILKVTNNKAFRMGICSNILLVIGALGLGGSGTARLELGPPEHQTVASWYGLLANKSKPAYGPSESEFRC